MLALAQWLSETPMSLRLRDVLWLIPLVQTIHILAIAVVVSSVLMIDLRFLRITRSQSIAATAHRFVPWLWSGLAVLAVSGVTLIIAEPKRALPNPAFQTKMFLLAAAIALTCCFQVSLRGYAAFWTDVGQQRPTAKILIRLLAMATFALWCAIAIAGRLIAYVGGN